MNFEAIFGLTMIPILLLLFVLYGFEAMFGFIAIIELFAVIIQLNLYFRSRNIYFLWMAVSLFIVFIFATDLALFGLDKMKAEFPALAVGVVLAAIIIIYIVANKKVKWRTREILELSAMPVSDVQDGFTERPHPLGKIQASGLEAEAFTTFIKKNLIAIPYIEDDVPFYSLTSDYWKQMGIRRSYKDDSWVSMDKNGNINVFIAKGDYLKYKDNFSFDQLCRSMGNLFVEFFTLFKRGDGLQIINRLNNLKLNPMIE
ncbi:MAG: hypothetical protein K8R53_08030 [Bacteroidales bacterium]|nr:hypothetical protein [Bacteroidales bacterium]